MDPSTEDLPLVDPERRSASFAPARLERRPHRTVLPILAVAAVLVAVVASGLLGRSQARPMTALDGTSADPRVFTPDASATPRPAVERLVLTSPSHHGAFAGSTELRIVGYVRDADRLVHVRVADDLAAHLEATVRTMPKPGDPAAGNRSWFDVRVPLADLPLGPLWVEVELLAADGGAVELVRRGVSREVARDPADSPILGGRTAGGEQGTDGIAGGRVFGGADPSPGPPGTAAPPVP